MIQSLLLSQSDCEGGASGRLKCLLAGVQNNSPQCILSLPLALSHTHTPVNTDVHQFHYSQNAKTGAHKQDLVTVSVHQCTTDVVLTLPDRL